MPRRQKSTVKTTSAKTILEPLCEIAESTSTDVMECDMNSKEKIPGKGGCKSNLSKCRKLETLLAAEVKSKVEDEIVPAENETQKSSKVDDANVSTETNTSEKSNSIHEIKNNCPASRKQVWEQRRRLHKSVSIKKRKIVVDEPKCRPEDINPEDPILCSICGASSSCEYAAQTHFQRCHKNLSYAEHYKPIWKCKYCPNKFESFGLYNIHVRVCNVQAAKDLPHIQTPSTSFHSDASSMDNEQRDKFLVEKQFVKELRHSCLFCDYTSKRLGFINMHIRKKHKARDEVSQKEACKILYRCEGCNAYVKTFEDIEEHNCKSAYELKKAAQIEDKLDLYADRVEKFISTKYECPACDYLARDVSTLVGHAAIKHFESDINEILSTTKCIQVPSYKCLTCSKLLGSITNLSIHFQTCGGVVLRYENKKKKKATPPRSTDK